jgi:hypothetical protein
VRSQINICLSGMDMHDREAHRHYTYITGNAKTRVFLRKYQIDFGQSRTRGFLDCRLGLSHVSGQLQSEQACALQTSENWCRLEDSNF